MTIRFDHLLRCWYPRKDELDWVLATITDTSLSTYRKAGAMMLMNGLGESYGMLSGGCLESDLLTQARKVLMSGKSVLAKYDLREESDSIWQKGLGCGGSVSILLQAVDVKNDYLGLDKIHHLLSSQQKIIYHQRLNCEGSQHSQWRVEQAEKETISFFLYDNTRKTRSQKNGEWLQTLISPSPILLIFGGGRDAQPLARIANDIGWQVRVVDQRSGYAKNEDFAEVTIIRDKPDSLSAYQELHKADAIVIMNHNITLDALSLKFAHASSAKYVGILGPEHRRQKVEQIAGLKQEDFKQFYCGPMGLDIGAKLPETIALSILSQCHQIVECKTTQRKRNEACKEQSQ